MYNPDIITHIFVCVTNVVIVQLNVSEKIPLKLLYHLIIQIQNSRFKINTHHFCQVNYI